MCKVLNRRVAGALPGAVYVGDLSSGGRRVRGPSGEAA